MNRSADSQDVQMLQQQLIAALRDPADLKYRRANKIVSFSQMQIIYCVIGITFLMKTELINEHY